MTMGGLQTVHPSRIECARNVLAASPGSHSAGFASADQLLITKIQDIHWLTGFTGSNAVVLVGAETVLLLTDGRYRTQAPREVSVARIHISESNVFTDLVRFLGNNVIFQSDHLTVSRETQLAELAPGTTFDGKENLLTPFRATKDTIEISHIQEALLISEKTIAACTQGLSIDITERELAAEIDYQHAHLGSEGPSFDTIVAFGSRSALPHASPGDVKLRPGDVVLIDCGCKIGGYASDITRTFLFGAESAGSAEVREVQDVYSIVLEALNAAIAEAKSGMTASDLDFAARSIIEASGYGEYFVHSLGHGVGLEIHELPRISTHSSQVLPENSVVTIEPGIYLPDRFGIRIEEMVLLTPNGGKRLNSLSTDFSLI